jgi:hypothetical protein
MHPLVFPMSLDFTKVERGWRRFLGTSIFCRGFGGVAVDNRGVLDINGPNLAVTAPLHAKVDASGVSSTIHDAARITDWDKVLTLCVKHPQHAKYSGNGLTPRYLLQSTVSAA